MITRKFLLSALTVLAVIFTPGCKEEDAEFVSMNVETKNISVGEEFQFFVTVQSTSNSVYGGAVKWSVDDESVASIDQTGKVLGKADGETTVKASLDNGRYAIAKLYVGNRSVTADSVYIARQNIYIKQAATDTVNVWISPKFSDVTCFPITAELFRLNDDGTIGDQNGIKSKCTLYAYKDYMLGLDPAYDGGELPDGFTTGKVYVIVLESGDTDENLACSVSVGDLTQNIEVHVDFSLYLSFNTIEPSNPGNNPGSENNIDITTEGSGTLTYNFYVDDDNAGDLSFAKVKEALLDKSNYSVSGVGVTLGTPVITPDTYQAGQSYSLSMDISAGSVGGNGNLVISAFGKQLLSHLNVDDGSTYKAVYISFTRPNTYTIPPTEMTLTTSVTADMSADASNPNKFKIRVYHYIDPDTRAAFIDWNIEQSGDPVIIPLGRQVSADNLYTEFEYQVGTSAGSASVSFSVYNPQGEQGGTYAEYLNQTITASVTIQDKASIPVSSVTFNPDNIETNAATVPLEAVMDPATSATAWPITYTVTEGADLAEAVANKDDDGNITSWQLNVKKAGTIKVKAQAGEGDKEKSDELTVVAKLRLDQVMISQGRSPLEITTAPSSLYVGEEGTVTKLLHANYTVDESEFTWRSSNPDILSVDANGKVTALAEGTAAVIVEIKDDYNTYASDQREITVRTLSIDADISALPSDYYVVYFAGDPIFFVDTEAGSSDYYTFSLDTEILTADGTYTAGTDFSGTVTFPVSAGSTECEITGGTIQVSGGVATFNLTVSYEGATGTITGSKQILAL